MSAADSAAEPARRGAVLSGGATFAAASTALVLVFASSGTPIPLYNLYRTADGIANAQLAVATVVYLSVTALSLLTLGRLSDHLGRKPVAVAALLLSALGCLLLAQVHALPLLMAGRVLQGIACGLAASSLGSFVVDTSPASPRWLGPLMAGSAPTFGIPLGAVVSGVLVEAAPAPRSFGYEIVAGLLVAVAAVLLFGEEPVHRRRGALRSLRPRVQLPAGARRAALMVVVSATFLATWSFSGFYQAFAPALTADHLGTDNSIVVALVFSSIVVLSPAGGALSGRFRAPIAIRIGVVGFLVAVLAALVSLHAGSIVAFLAASLLASLASGAATTGAMRALLTGATPALRAGLISTVYLISYAGAALPGLVASSFAGSVDLVAIATGYGCLVLVAVIVAVVATRRLGPARPPASDAA